MRKSYNKKVYYLPSPHAHGFASLRGFLNDLWREIRVIVERFDLSDDVVRNIILVVVGHIFEKLICIGKQISLRGLIIMMIILFLKYPIITKITLK